jgi:hypothetical protein
MSGPIWTVIIIYAFCHNWDESVRHHASFFSKWGLMNFMPQLAWNLDPPNVSLPRSWDDRPGPPVPGNKS